MTDAGEKRAGHVALQLRDLIATGTPEGVGPIAPWDRIDLWIDHAGHLGMSVRSD